MKTLNDAKTRPGKVSGPRNGLLALFLLGTLLATLVATAAIALI
ncbi:hypothetical protein [Frigidibacter sp. MR17.24]